MQKLNDLSRSLAPLKPDGTLIAVIEMKSVELARCRYRAWRRAPAVEEARCRRDRIAKTTASMARGSRESWFFLTANFAFGEAMQRDATRVIETAGGKVVGSVRHPLNTTDFSSFLLQAQSTRAKIGGTREWWQRPDQLNQAGGGVRHCPRRTASRSACCVHHRGSCRGARQRALEIAVWKRSARSNP